MRNWRRFVLWSVMIVALLGVFVAIANLPVLTGCGYYGRCGPAAIAD